MGHQVNFFVLPADLPIIEAAVRVTGDVCFLRDRTPTATPVDLGTLAAPPDGESGSPLTRYIVRRSEVDAVKMQFIDTQGYWVIKSTDSPVVEFSSCFFDGTVLRRGRAYFDTDLRFRPNLPGREFIKWGDRVLARIRKVLTRAPEIGHSLYTSANARQWIREEGASDTGGAVEFRAPPSPWSIGTT